MDKNFDRGIPHDVAPIGGAGGDADYSLNCIKALERTLSIFSAFSYCCCSISSYAEGYFIAPGRWRWDDERVNAVLGGSKISPLYEKPRKSRSPITRSRQGQSIPWINGPIGVAADHSNAFESV